MRREKLGHFLTYLSMLLRTKQIKTIGTIQKWVSALNRIEIKVSIKFIINFSAAFRTFTGHLWIIILYICINMNKRFKLWKQISDTYSLWSCKFTNLLATDVPSSFNLDHLFTCSCQVAQQSLSLLATSDKFLLGNNFGEVDFEITSFLDGVFWDFGDLNFFGVEVAMLDELFWEDWVWIKRC